MTEIPQVGLSKKGGRYNGQFRPEFSRLYEDPDLLLITPLPVRYVVGVVGKRWSGKSATLTILREELGFDVHGLTDLVRATAEAQGRDSTDRRVLQEMADAARVEHASPSLDNDFGDGAYLARRMLRRLHDHHVHHSRRLNPPQRVALNGFGHPDEVEVFCRLPQFRIVRLVCDEEAREARVPDGRLEKDAEAFGLSFTNSEEAFAQVDRCDLDGSEVSPWAGDCVHSVQAVLDRVKELAMSDEPTAGGVQAKELVFDLDIESKSGQSDLESIVSKLDRQFRTL
jgi:hypothetical protein